MVGIDEDDDLVGTEGDRENARIINNMGEDGDVRFQFEDPLQRLVGIAEQHRHVDLRIVLQEARDHFGGVERADGGDPQRAYRHVAAILQKLACFFVQAHDAAADLVKRGTRIGEFDAPAASHQELDAVALL